MPLIERCVCNGRLFRVVEGFGLPLRECRSCFVLHQHVDMSADGLAEWYRTSYHASVYTHGYGQDLETGRRRVARYAHRLKGPVLDIGCGNGGFLDACREAGIEAEGQDIGGRGAEHPGPLSAMDHLAGRFSTVTMHDVLEHAVDPIALLLDAWQLLAKDGGLIVDFPDFFAKAGEHHWKPTEHLWMLSERQLERTIDTAGFTVRGRDRPIPGKIVLYAAR